jgi:rod shape-determining protein MreC
MRELLHRFRIPLVGFALVVLAAAALLRDRDHRARGGRDLSGGNGALLEVAIPVQRAIAAPFVFARGLWRRYVDVLDVRAENERLRARVERLEDENLQFREALLQSGQLDALAALRDATGVPMLPARIAGRDASPWFRSVLLDRGRSHGVRAGMPAVTSSGVAGLVTATSAHAGKAMLLLDPQSAVDGMVQRSRAQGIVRGLGTALLEFEFDADAEDVQPGDVVITSGLGGVYPKGLRVGEVKRVNAVGGRHMMRQADLEPAVDFDRLEDLYVLLWRSPALEFLYGDDDPDVATAPGEPPRADAPATGP